MNPLEKEGRLDSLISQGSGQDGTGRLVDTHDE